MCVCVYVYLLHTQQRNSSTKHYYLALAMPNSPNLTMKQRRAVGKSTHTSLRMYICMYVCMYVCMYACMYVYMYVFVYVCVYVCMYVCMYV